jgi:integrase
MGIYKRGDTGQWAISYVAEDGTRRRYTVGTKKEAEDELRRVTGPQRCTLRLSRYMPGVIKSVSLTSQGAMTAVNYGYCAVALADKLGDPTLSEIDLGMVRAYQAERSQEVQNATVNREVMFLSKVLTQAVMDGHIAINPLRGLRDKGQKLLLPEPRTRLRFLSLEEIARLERECRDPLLGIVQVAIRTGMRMREIFQLTWSNCHLREGYCDVRRKHKREYQQVPLPPLTVKAIARQKRKSTFVFPGKYGDQRTNCSKAFGAALDRAGLDDVTFHTLRHTFASHAVMGGMDLVTLQHILGHAKLDMVMRYAHLADEHRVSQMAKIEQRLSRANRPSVTDSVTGSRKVFRLKRRKSLSNKVGD